MIKTLLIFLIGSMAWAADVAGAWDVVVVWQNGEEVKAELVIEDQGGNLGGTISNEQGSLPLEDVKVAGDDLSYKVSYRGGLVFKMTGDGKTMKGTFTSGDGATGKISATKK